MLTNPESVTRIADPESYRDQPNLDIYAPAFAGMGLSPRFAGTDVDGIFAAVLRSNGHGLWERDGYVLVQEHKKSNPDSIQTGGGQHRAFLTLNDIAPTRLRVIYTFGPTDNPTKQKWAHVNRLDTVKDFTADIENWPHRLWIRWVMYGRPIIHTSRTSYLRAVATLLEQLAEIDP